MHLAKETPCVGDDLFLPASRAMVPGSQVTVKYLSWGYPVDRCSMKHHFVQMFLNNNYHGEKKMIVREKRIGSVKPEALTHGKNNMLSLAAAIEHRDHIAD